MKKLFFLFIAVSFIQRGESQNFGIGNTGQMSVDYKDFEVQTLHHISTNARYRFLTTNFNYHSGIIFIGYGTEGISAGVRVQKGDLTFTVGEAGKYPYAMVGVKAHAYKPSKFLTENDQLLIVSNLASGFFRGWHEAIQSLHWGSGQFWDNKVSWKNKYKDGDPSEGDKYFLSSTTLVWTTDGYHLTNLLTNISNLATLAIALRSKDGWSFKKTVKKVLLSGAANALGFYIAYEKVYK